jgi:DNA (cytosine-5)-methyltransferase 3A
MNVLSLFDGISCGRVALERAGIQVENYYASEIDKYAIQIALKNYQDTIQVGSVVDIKSEDYKDIDLLIGGSPCQDLSIAKKGREGLRGSRSGLFYEYVRILKELKPKYFILENVNSMPKEAKETITKELFGIEPIMINAALVSAQNRKRLFWVGKLVGDTYEKVDISLPEDQGILLRDILEQEVDESFYVKNQRKNTLISNRPQDINRLKGNTLLVGGTNPTIRIGQIGNGGQGDRIYSQDGKSVNLSANGGGRGAKTGLYCVGLIDGKNSQGKRVYSADGKSVTLSAGSKAGGESGRRTGVYLQNEGIRKLTPIECERLQSLPDNYTEGVSNTQRYKALGNAFNVDVIAHILKNLK